MAVAIKEYNGAGPTASTITHLKHRTSDAYVNDATHPIPKPAAGSNHGYWKTIALYSDVLNTDIYSDIKIYGGGDPSWTGVILYIGDEVSDTYDQATGTEDSSGDEIVANHNQVTAKTNFWTTYTSLNMKTVGCVGGAASVGPLVSEQRISKHAFFQATVGTTAVAGSLTNGTIYFRYSVTS